MTTETMTEAQTLTKGDATIELSVLNSATHDLEWVDIVTMLNNRGAKLELVTRMQDLWEKTKIIAGEVVNIGRVILLQIWEFVKTNPNMILGAVIGAAIGALTLLIPFVGQFLAPIAIAIGSTLGALAGHRIDKVLCGEQVSNSIFEDLITAAKRFFQFIIDIFGALRNEYFADGF